MTDATCPWHAFDPLTEQFADAPYELLREARENEPVFFAPALGLWVVTSYELVKNVLRDTTTYSSSNAQRPLQPYCAEAQRILREGAFAPVPSLTSLDPPDHTRLRRHFGSVAAFLPGRMDSMREWIRAQIDACIDVFATRGSADLIAELTAPIPARVVYRLLGFPPEDSLQLQSWCVSRLQLNWARPSEAEQQQIARNLVAFWQYTERFVRTRMRAPADDYTSDLLKIHLADPTAITLPELTSFVYGLTFAGQETTVNSMGSMLRLLLEERDQWERLVREPRLIPNAVEESLRLEPPIAAWRRVVRKQTRLGDVDLAPGDQLLLHLGAAGRDSRRFADGDRLDVTRSNASAHLAFGFGAHYCLGNSLARLESTLMLEQLTCRLPGLRLEAGQRYGALPNLSFRGPLAVRVRWETSAAGGAAG